MIAELQSGHVRLLEDRDLAIPFACDGRELVQRKFSFKRLIVEIDSLCEELLQAKDVSA